MLYLFLSNYSLSKKLLIYFMFMQYLFWEKVQPLDDEAFDPLAHEYPLMLNWSQDEAKKRDTYDTSYGRGNGMVSYY